jgi:alcohol dehydrogenase class IV
MQLDYDLTGAGLDLTLPRTVLFGEGCATRAADELAARGCRRVGVITARAVLPLVAPLCQRLREQGLAACVWDAANREPTIGDFEEALQFARESEADAVIGFGGGSALDVAKLTAALLDGRQNVREAFGVGQLLGRRAALICVPTTAGTGSEVSPNALLLDEAACDKKGVMSPHLVPDVACVDPLLTLGLPPDVTASTGLDALTHCVEAYANRFAHPLVDLYALEGARLIAGSLRRACDDGGDRAARAALSLGSLYGGLCLGPVNTGAVHALAYPLGGVFGIPHGVANALLLPHVLTFNLPAAPERYARLARSLGLPERGCAEETARQLVGLVADLSRDLRVPQSLAAFGVAESDLAPLAASALRVTRLLSRNVREVRAEDALALYRKAFE